jgi:uncharacterized protein
MKFKVEDLEYGTVNLRRLVCRPEEIGLDLEDLTFASPIDVNLSMIRYDAKVFMDANVLTSIKLECRRCLTEYVSSIRVKIEMEYSPMPNGREDDPFRDEIGIGYYSGDYLDISDDVRQYITLEIPIWPLCSEGCKGLCSQCGQNLNDAPCNCTPLETKNSKFAILNQILKKGNA